jgi:hypothetical protein
LHIDGVLLTLKHYSSCIHIYTSEIAIARILL